MAEEGGNRPKSGLWGGRDGFTLRHDMLMGRSRKLAAVRDFFAENGFVEVETPALQVSPGLEPHLRAFGVVPHVPFEGKAQPWFLHTSPEFAMKKLLASGLPRIWQLAHVFRDGEHSATHHPEFAMLEWYRAEAGYRDLMQECEALLRQIQAAAGCSELRWQGRTADVNRAWERLTVAEAFDRYTGIDILGTIDDPVRPQPGQLAGAAAAVGIAPHPGDDWETLFFRVFLERIEPQLGVGAPTILYEYPISMAALSRRKPEDSRLAERFELYVCGLELANAFGELTDPAEQRARFAADQARKQALYGEMYPIDEDFLAALDHGLPQCAGIALGFDRLVMLATRAERIDEVLWAPVA